MRRPGEVEHNRSQEVTFYRRGCGAHAAKNWPLVRSFVALKTRSASGNYARALSYGMFYIYVKRKRSARPSHQDDGTVLSFNGNLIVRLSGVSSLDLVHYFNEVQLVGYLTGAQNADAVCPSWPLSLLVYKY